MSGGGSTASKNLMAAILGTAAVIAVLAGIGAVFGDSSRDTEVRRDSERDDVSNQVVILQAVAGTFIDGGFAGSERELTITYWIDGVRHAGDQAQLEGGLWTEILALPLGTHVRLLVEQHGEGGFLQCTISSNGKILFPNGYEHRNDAGDCDVEGVVGD